SPVVPGEACMRFNAEDEIAEGRLAIGGFQDAAGRPESAYILSLPEPTCLDADDPEYRVDSADTIQIYSSDDAVHAQIEAFVGMTVLVRGSPFGAHTAHHHAPIIMDISEIDTQ
ncbi:MAG: DUF4431 domain-containing protein, partial [Hyphomicrobiales bacterium]|nr:DUF4431 domain-containing protein [Hyphomicrobiales bacterium]